VKDAVAIGTNVPFGSLGVQSIKTRIDSMKKEGPERKKRGKLA